MLDDMPIKVGDKLVGIGRVFKVFKIADSKTYDGKVEKHIFFKPIYDTPDNRTVTCCIPFKNIVQANIRRPIDKKAMSLVIKGLSEPSKKGDIIADAIEAKEILKKNDPRESAKVLKSVWLQLNSDDIMSTRSRKDLFDLAINNLSQEVALVYDIPLEKASEKLQRALKKTA